MNKHVIWAITLLTITILLCGTILYVNSHPLTIEIKTDLRADDNSKNIINNALAISYMNKPEWAYWEEKISILNESCDTENCHIIWRLE